MFLKFRNDELSKAFDQVSEEINSEDNEEVIEETNSKNNEKVIDELKS